MRVLKPSRKKPKEGDVFTLQLPDGLYSFGRVINTGANAGFGVGAQLIYIFKFRSEMKNIPDRVELRVDHLLLPPMMTNLLPWSRGYFETLGNLSFAEREILATHCFHSAMFDRYYDEHAVELPQSVEPVGAYGLESFSTIDDAVSKALGFPLVPED
jgi:hypothetical protein|nr:immunity 26/phosphotriesterase HocA family protein [Paenarthrobacter ureafaciens]